MVANNKNSVSSGEEVAPAAKVGDGGQPVRPRKISLRRPSKKVIFAVSLLILVIIGVVAIINYKSSPSREVYAQAAGHKIYKDDIDNIKHGDPSITNQQAATVLADKYLAEAMAKEHHVTVSQTDINAADTTGAIKEKKQNPYAYQNLVNQVYFTKLAANNEGSYQGKLLIANFSRYVPLQSSLLPQQKVANPKLGDPAAIAADKKYARDFIMNLYNRIKGKKITFDQAIQIEHDDPVVGENAYQTQPHSQEFNGSLHQIAPLSAYSIQGKIANIQQGQLTTPFVVRTANSVYDAKSTAESYFLVVQLDGKSGGDGSLTFPQELTQAKKQLGYKINV